MRYKCKECGWVGDKILQASNPFAPSEAIFGCPSCHAIDSMERRLYSSKMNEFLKELADLLGKYDAEIDVLNEDNSWNTECRLNISIVVNFRESHEVFAPPWMNRSMIQQKLSCSTSPESR